MGSHSNGQVGFAGIATCTEKQAKASPAGCRDTALQMASGLILVHTSVRKTTYLQNWGPLQHRSLLRSVLQSGHFSDWSQVLMESSQQSRAGLACREEPSPSATGLKAKRPSLPATCPRGPRSVHMATRPFCPRNTASSLPRDHPCRSADHEVTLPQSP